jgi:hypothetical protein
MQIHPVPEKWAGMWRTISKGIDDAQKWSIEAHKARDEGKMRLYGKMVADRVSAIGNVQRLAFPGLLEQLSKDRGKVAIHTQIQTEPPAMLVYDNDEEFYSDCSNFEDEVKRDGEGAQAFGLTSLQNPIRPMNPEGAD